jgi:hypothetical protein
MKNIYLIYADEGAQDQPGGLASARLVAALEAAGAVVTVRHPDAGCDALLDAVAAGAVPVIVKARTHA